MGLWYYVTADTAESLPPTAPLDGSTARRLELPILTPRSVTVHNLSPMCSPQQMMLLICSCVLLLNMLCRNAGALAFGDSSDIRSRRAFLHTASSSAAASIAGGSMLILTGSPATCSAATSSEELQIGLIEARVSGNVLSPPPYGREDADIIYPDWFRGTWDVYSETTTVEAPCGVPLFGGNSTFAAAKREIGASNALQYRARFV